MTEIARNLNEHFAEYTSSRYGDFRDLNVWKESRNLREIIWKLSKSLPSEEKFRLADQMIRASRSTTACIAEGYGRYHFQESIQFCRQSRGSLFELIDHLTVAHECEYLDSSIVNNLENKIKVAIRMLNGYIKYLKNGKESE